MPDRTVFTALEVKESDLLTVIAAPARCAARGKWRTLFVGTGNAGAFYVVRPQPPADAQYLSKAFAAPPQVAGDAYAILPKVAAHRDAQRQPGQA